ncbi:MAG: hypothetical protein IPO08_12075 [Xanthomonadales bacterium]|jgi:hypothetical protein|nr:hypothetical protein [Xanthomonadales bacterium]
MNRFATAALAALLMLVAADARAALYCVDNEAQLRAALATIGSSFDTSVHEIRLTQRVFFTGTQGFAVQVSGPTGDTVISGGWSAGASSACDVQTVDARLTVLDAQGTSSVLSVRRNSVSGAATPLIRVANLTLRNGNAESAPVGLNLANSFGSIEVDNVIAHGHRAVASQFIQGVAIHLDSSSNDISLRNSLIYDNVGNFIGGFPLSSVLFTSLSLNSNRNWYVTNNTIVAAPSQADSALRIQSDGNFWVINNVLRGAVAYTSSITGAGAAVDPLVRQLFNNLASTPLTDRATLVLNQGNSFVEPELDPITRALLPSSPLVNAGLGAPPGGVPALDAFGQPRVFGIFIDIGAIELQQPPVLPVRIFGNGFE